MTLFDASAVIAAIKGEPGEETVFALAQDAAISTVNLAEVFGYAARSELSASVVDVFLEETGIAILPLSREEAARAGEYLPLTKSIGLSLADRCCLAVASIRRLTLAATDRPLLEFAGSIGIETEALR
jgi:ribonuclease VapC